MTIKRDDGFLNCKMQRTIKYDTGQIESGDFCEKILLYGKRAWALRYITFLIEDIKLLECFPYRKRIRPVLQKKDYSDDDQTMLCSLKKKAVHKQYYCVLWVQQNTIATFIEINIKRLRKSQITVQQEWTEVYKILRLTRKFQPVFFLFLLWKEKYLLIVTIEHKGNR